MSSVSHSPPHAGDPIVAEFCALASRLSTTSSIPPASPTTSLTAKHLLYFLVAPSVILSWPLLREALVATYGDAPTIGMDAIESGLYGLSLVARAFENEEKDSRREGNEGVSRERERETLERRKWILKLTEAAFQAE